jgi:hypothetical protein
MKTLIKKITPEPVWNRLYEYKQRWNRCRTISYLRRLPEGDITDEQREVLDYLIHHPMPSMFPYEYVQKYRPEDIVAYLDTNRGMRYVLQDGKRLYFRRGWNEKQVQGYYCSLSIEQDRLSPHRYETSNFCVAEGDVVVDVGAAEGNFALSVVERARELYLFEPDEEWIEPLEATFAPFRDRVHIVSCCVSDRCGDGQVSLDDFFEEKGKVDFIKADIEGAEVGLLKGAEVMLSRQASAKVALCTYHRHDDADVLKQMLEESGFRTEFSRGYMTFCSGERLKPPYLRRGLIRGVKE